MIGIVPGVRKSNELRGLEMTRLPCWAIVAPALALFWGCGSSGAQERAYKSQSKVHQERLNLVDEYKKCLDKAADDNVKVEAYDSYLKAAEALK